MAASRLVVDRCDTQLTGASESRQRHFINFDHCMLIVVSEPMCSSLTLMLETVEFCFLNLFLTSESYESPINDRKGAPDGIPTAVCGASYSPEAAFGAARARLSCDPWS